MTTPSEKILLATELGSRSDRARDRAASLAKQRDCELIVLHVLESSNKNNSIRRIPFLPFLDYNKIAIEKVRKRLLEDMSSVHARADKMIEEGEPHEIIMRVAEKRKCDLIVTGVPGSRATTFSDGTPWVKPLIG
ncbi:MAG TPA: universal stress protein [Spirochaetota bacterium]|nr:universal stress protein [Spirochaetota bacterium]HQF09344.1 universal stress protein [Spirochaetota bacterium]HQH98042.1 universal stress protein [Spirochaetota bacterium]